MATSLEPHMSNEYAKKRKKENSPYSIFLRWTTGLGAYIEETHKGGEWVSGGVCISVSRRGGRIGVRT